MRKALTDRELKALAANPATGNQFTVWDALLPGFGVRVSGGGKLSFILMRRPAGSPRPVRVTLGHHGAMSLKKASEEASKALSELLAGKKPTEERRRRLERQAEADATTFAGVAKRYLDHVAEKRALQQITGIVQREFLPRWDGRPIASISRREITAMVDEIKGKKPGAGIRKAGGPAAARQALGYCKRIFRFAVARDLLDASPADAVSGEELIGARKPRQRVLSDQELRKVLTAFPWDTREGVEPQDRGRWPTAPLLWLLALLGVRRGELAAATWDRIDLDKGTWLIPAENAKTAEPHLVPLPAMAVRIFESLPQFAGHLVFTTNGVSQIGGWSVLKAEIDYKSGVTGWTLHDLRRGARSGWSALGVAPYVSELMLGHVRRGIEGTYDVYGYLPERKAALEAWSRRIAEIVAPPPPASSNVVGLPRRA
jgi:integrase